MNRFLRPEIDPSNIESNIENNEHYAIATILNPRFRKLYFENKLSCNNAINKIDELLTNVTRNE